MAYDEKLADRLRRALRARRGLTEKKMFGGLAFMIWGNMCCGVIGDDLVVRVPPEKTNDLVRYPHARPMDFTGRPMRGFIYVGAKGIVSGMGLKSWLKIALDFAGNLPPKTKSKPPRSNRTR